VASLTKLLVALCCLVAWEEGTVDLDDAVGPPGSTLAHLLAHASGRLSRGQPVGRRRAGGASTQLRHRAGGRAPRGPVGMHFGDYLQVGVLSPLGMNGTLFEGSPAHGATGRLSTCWRWPASLSRPP